LAHVNYKCTREDMKLLDFTKTFPTEESCKAKFRFITAGWRRDILINELFIYKFEKEVEL